MKICDRHGKKKIIGAGGVVFALLAVFATQPAFAEDFDGTPTYFNWGSGGIVGLLITILNWMAIGVSIAVVGGIIYGAIMYTTSGGNSEQAHKAIGIIRNAVIALILYFAMWALLNFLVPGGLFKPQS